MASILLWSVGLFMAGGAVWVLIGALTPFAMDTQAGRSTLLFSNADDEKTFGATPAEVLAKEPNVATLRTVLLRVLAGFLVVSGLMVVTIAWFALRHGATWAYATLCATALAVLPFWFLAAKPFLAAGTSIGWLDVPPFMWVPTALWLPAIALGGWALKA